MNPLQAVNFVVFDRTGVILRTGRCARRDLARQVKLGSGEGAIEGTANDVTDRVEIPAEGPPFIIQRPAAEVAAYHTGIRARVSRRLSPLAPLLEALRTKGIEVTPEDLAAAAERLRGPRGGPA